MPDDPRHFLSQSKNLFLHERTSAITEAEQNMNGWLHFVFKNVCEEIEAYIWIPAVILQMH